ncbi:MAG TPA: hypothetical protein VE133_18920, partial [Candidatus Sulfotelmatobacter sp.]|nr:hypothetical protein [Candidatus Sulfotelmatobacter sp.]
FVFVNYASPVIPWVASKGAHYEKKVMVVLVGFIHFARVAAGVVHAQTSGQFPEMDKNGKPLIPRANPFLFYSPADLAHSAVVLPASPTATSNTAIVRTSGATALTYFINCTQTMKVTMNVYTADDLPNATTPFVTYTLYGSYDLTTTTVTSGPQQIYVGTELAPTATIGTLGAAVRLPQIAVSFSETNVGATPGTCTGRLAVKYN